MGEPKGRPKTLVRRHVLEIKKDTQEWLTELLEKNFDQQSTFPKARVAGAAFVAAGTYGIISFLPDPFKTARDLAVELRAQNPDIPDWQIWLGTFGDLGFTFLNLFGAGIEKKKNPLLTDIIVPEKIEFNAFAFFTAMMAGGLVLAGQNPGEVIKGIGEIIPG